MRKNKGHKVKPRSKNFLESVSIRFRKLFGYGDHDCFDVLKLLEFVMPQIDDNFVLQVLTKEEMGSKEGNTFPDLHVIQLREDVYELLKVNDGRARFTATHELGHLLIHNGIEPEFAREDSYHMIYEDSEWQADKLAAYLLMPTEGCLGLDSQEISDKFLTSASASVIREKEVKKIP